MDAALQYSLRSSAVANTGRALFGFHIETDAENCRPSASDFSLTGEGKPSNARKANDPTEPTGIRKLEREASTRARGVAAPIENVVAWVHPGASIVQV